MPVASGFHRRSASVATRYLGWPNRITITRILLIGPFVVCLLNLNEPGAAWLRWLAVGIFGVMAASDLLDGYLARRLHDESPLGRFLDPLADKLLITTAVLFLGIVGISDPAGASDRLRLPNWAVVAAIGKDVFVCLGFAVVYFATGRVFIEPRAPGKLCTVVQLVMVLAMLVAFEAPASLRGPVMMVLWCAATALAVVSAVDYVIVGARLVAGHETGGSE